VSAAFKGAVKRLLGPGGVARWRALRRGQALPIWGNLRRPRPFSEYFGFDRGTPIDRYYLDRFLSAHRLEIHGEVLEIQLPDCARRYGQGVTAVHTVDIDPRFSPTYCCDLASAGIIADARYDCFLLPNTLPYLRHLERALVEALRIVRPGGTILATASTFVPLVTDMADYWRLSAAGWEELASKAWPDCRLTVESHGNCLSAVAAMLGLASEELSPAELDGRDPRYPVLVTLHCQKPGPEERQT
jgi:hypothetical protein